MAMLTIKSEHQLDFYTQPLPAAKEMERIWRNMLLAAASKLLSVKMFAFLLTGGAGSQESLSFCFFTPLHVFTPSPWWNGLHSRVDSSHTLWPLRPCSDGHENDHIRLGSVFRLFQCSDSEWLSMWGQEYPCYLNNTKLNSLGERHHCGAHHKQRLNKLTLAHCVKKMNS